VVADVRFNEMKKTIQIVVAVIVIANMTGCASPYMTDRRHDAADIFTATLGVGGGAKFRGGPFGLGLMFNPDCIGLKGGELMTHWTSFPSFHDVFTSSSKPNGGDVHYLLLGGEEGNSSAYAKMRNKDYLSFYFLGIPMPTSPCPAPKYPPSYWTQIDIAAGIGRNVKLGLNPGELLDFILGWTTIDIYNDDLEARKNREESNQVPEDTVRTLADPQGDQA